jgi:hypothetical protein
MPGCARAISVPRRIGPPASAEICEGPKADIDGAIHAAAASAEVRARSGAHMAMFSDRLRPLAIQRNREWHRKLDRTQAPSEHDRGFLCQPAVDGRRQGNGVARHGGSCTAVSGITNCREAIFRRSTATSLRGKSGRSCAKAAWAARSRGSRARRLLGTRDPIVRQLEERRVGFPMRRPTRCRCEQPGRWHRSRKPQNSSTPHRKRGRSSRGGSRVRVVRAGPNRRHPGCFAPRPPGRSPVACLFRAKGGRDLSWPT